MTATDGPMFQCMDAALNGAQGIAVFTMLGLFSEVKAVQGLYGQCQIAVRYRQWRGDKGYPSRSGGTGSVQA